MDTASSFWLDFALFAGLHGLASIVIVGVLGIFLTPRVERDDG